MVLITGFESFNVELYKKAAVALARACPGFSLRVFSDRDLGAMGGEGVGHVCFAAADTAAAAAALMLVTSLLYGTFLPRAGQRQTRRPSRAQARAALRWRRRLRAPTSSSPACCLTLTRRAGRR